LPVTSSKPSKTIKTNPTGKIRAPTIGKVVCLLAVNARHVPNPSRAPERKPRIRKSETESDALLTAVLSMFLATSSGLR
jgi:hypothetical protein